MDHKDETLLTVQDVSGLLQVASVFVYRHAREMGALKVGSHLRFRRRDVVAWLETREMQPVAEVPSRSTQRSRMLTPPPAQAIRRKRRKIR